VSRRWARILLREWGSATAPVPGADDPRGQGHLRSTTRRLLTQKPRSKPLDERFVTVIQSVRGCSPLWCTAEDALRLNDTVPFTAVGCGCCRPWFTSGSLAARPQCAGQSTCHVGLAGAAVRDIPMPYGEHY
jgi:hypothetical protein